MHDALQAAGAEFAAVALRNIETRPEQRAAGQHTQQRSHRADRVAPRASAAPGEEGEPRERHDGDEEHPEALHPHLHRIESVAVHPLGDPGQSVVAPRIDRCEKIRCDPTVGAVRGDQPADARQHRRDEHRQHRPAQPRERGRVAEAIAVLFTPPREPRHDVLHHPQRTDDRTINPSEKQGQRHERQHHADVHGQQGGQELDFRHPAEPRMERPRKVEEQQGNQQKEEDRRNDPDFSQHLYLSLLYGIFTPAGPIRTPPASRARIRSPRRARPRRRRPRRAPRVLRDSRGIRGNTPPCAPSSECSPRRPSG